MIFYAFSLNVSSEANIKTSRLLFLKPMANDQLIGSLEEP